MKAGDQSSPLLSHQWHAEVLGCLGPTRFLDARGRANRKKNFDSSPKISDDLLFSHEVTVIVLQNWVIGRPPSG